MSFLPPVEGCFLKGEGHYKEPAFLSLPVAIHSAFSVTKFPADKVSVILKKFVSKEGTSEVAILICTWQPGGVFVFKHPPIVAYRRTSNPRDILVKAKLPTIRLLTTLVYHRDHSAVDTFALLVLTLLTVLHTTILSSLLV